MVHTHVGLAGAAAAAAVERTSGSWGQPGSLELT